MLLRTLILILALGASPDLAAGAQSLDALRQTFARLYESLRAQGGIAESDRALIASVRERVAVYNAENPDDASGIAMELQLSQWLGDHDRVDELFGRLATREDELDIGLAWVDYFRKLGDRRRIGAILDRLARLHPGDPALALQRARFFLDANLYARAIDVLEQAAIDPAEHPRAALTLGQSYFAEHRFGEAIETLESIPDAVLAADPSLAAEVERALDLARPYPELWAEEQQIRSAEAAADDLPRVELMTSKGPILIELFENEAPNTVANFIELAGEGFYDGTEFHRVIPNFMAQGGDPNTKPGAEGSPGTGGPGYRIPDEHDREGARMHFAGSVSMANVGTPHSGGSQFFLTHTPTAHLNGKHTVFGRILVGLDVARSLEQGDVLETATVLRKRDHPYEPQTLPEAGPAEPAAPPAEVDLTLPPPGSVTPAQPEAPLVPPG